MLCYYVGIKHIVFSSPIFVDYTVPIPQYGTNNIKHRLPLIHSRCDAILDHVGVSILGAFGFLIVVDM